MSFLTRSFRAVTNASIRGLQARGRIRFAAASSLSTDAEPNTLERQITQEVDQLYENTLKPVDYFNHIVPRRRSGMPMVLVVGNHSSGKSTFINHLLAQGEQDTGLAPTDDCFTAITTKKNVDGYNQDGNALISTAAWGFTDLDRFGPKLAAKLRLKVRPAQPNFPEGIMLVDTPGTIDALAEGNKKPQTASDRGYDFLQVTSWFAERADVILLFFDPNNPGTTRETLDVLTNSLIDLDYKLLLVLNKVDQFQLVHDFARAYGALCWNLAKVIPRKDLPKIHSMFIPTAENRDIDEKGVNKFGIPMTDFVEARNKVIAEVHSAPKRRIDNLLTRLVNTTKRLKMTALVTEEARAQFARAKLYYYGMTGLLATGSLGIGTAMLFAGLEGPAMLALTMLPMGGALATGLLAKSRIANKKREILDSITQLFESKYYMDLEDDAQHKELQEMWEGIRPRLTKSLEMRDLGDSTQVPKLKKNQLQALNNILNKDVPRLRKQYEDGRDK
eukprot:TRINITY_DN15152_c0_g1_i1.p1 TRINITY_DN15152_c0_g1~~TRINITY_DN15152_c0_g1_i1.p1  ORF type:complete len:503 (+),score=119.19 TRINITY_DN15152_c0_g1_i1:55-1563(+)